MTTVSIVIPTYNRAEVIERAIDSAIAQTVTETEIIVVDDASTDETVSILESYEDQIQYYCHDQNRGGSAARNMGISEASGDYIAFLDSDDVWKPTKLEKQINLLEDRGENWVAAYCDFKQTRSNRVVEKIDHFVRRPTGLEGGEELIDRIFLRTFAHGGASTIMVKRDALDELGGFDADFQRHQDLEFLVRLLQIGMLAYVDEVLVLKHDTGIPSAETIIEAADRFNEKFESLMTQRGLASQVKQVQRLMISKHYFSEGRFLEGMRYLRGAKLPHTRDAVGIGFSLLKGAKHRLSEGTR